MSFIERVYKIFCENPEQEKRFELMEQLYIKEYSSGLKESVERRWNFSVPLIKELVKLEFRENVIVDGFSGSCNGSSRLFIHLGSSIYHNSELIKMLLAVAKIWNTEIYVYSKMRAVCLSENRHCTYRHVTAVFLQ